MSAELCGGHAALQRTTVGGSKPLHRFLKGQPKTTGTVMLILGASFFIATVATMTELHNVHIWPACPPTFLLGAGFIATGILYILAEHNPTKKTVTISLALSILCVLGVGWTNLHILPHIGHYYVFRRYDEYYDVTMNITELDLPDPTPSPEHMLAAFEAVFVFYSFVGAIISIVMSALAGAALRSTKTQAIVVMTALPTEALTEEQP